MKTTLSLLLVSVLVIAPFAAAQDTDTATMAPTGGVDVGYEPDLTSLTCVTAPGDPSRCAQDANGLATAKAGTVTKVLEARWQDAAPSGRLFRTFAGRQFLVGTDGAGGGIEAYYGSWQDINANGFIDLPDNSDGDAEVVISADPERCDPARVPTVGSAGEGDGEGQDISVDDDNDADDDADAIVGAGPEAHTGVSLACNTPVEFDGIVGAKVVAYVTPGNFNDWVNGPMGYELGGTTTPSNAQPDFILGDGANTADTQGASDGTYFGPSAGFAQIWTDNGLLQSTLIEVIAEPKLDPDASRAYVSNAGVSVTDADLYRSVDSNVEGIYASSLGGIWYSDTVAGFNPDGGWAPAAQKGLVLATAGPAIGPAVAAVFPAQPTDVPDGKSVSGYATQFDLYLNVYVHEALGFEPGIGLAADVPSYSAGGTFGYFGVYGHVGAWKDKNGDGFIGAPSTAAGCGDAYNCGATPDPNNYFGAKTNGEFFETTAYNNDATVYYMFEVYLTPNTPGNVWGETGVYVFADRKQADTNSAEVADGDVIDTVTWNPDEDAVDDPGRARSKQYSFNPWDDIILEPADCALQTEGAEPCQAGDVPQLVESGTIVAHMVATTYSGSPYYSSWEHYILPGGNAGYTITVQSEPVDVQFQGLDLFGELVDTDTLPAM